MPPEETTLSENVAETLTGGDQPASVGEGGAPPPNPTSEDAEIDEALGAIEDEADLGDDDDGDGDEGDGEEDEPRGDEAEPTGDLQSLVDQAFEALQESSDGSEQSGDEQPQGAEQSGDEPPALMVDPDSFQYESERRLANVVNHQAQVIADMKTQLERFSQVHERVEQAEVRQIAEQAVGAMRGGAEAILATYGVNVKPEYLGALMRKHQSLVSEHGKFDTDIAVRVFEAEHWKELLAAKGRPSAAPKPKATTVSGGGARLGGRSASMTEDEMIERDLQGVPY